VLNVVLVNIKMILVPRFVSIAHPVKKEPLLVSRPKKFRVKIALPVNIKIKQERTNVSSVMLVSIKVKKA